MTIPFTTSGGTIGLFNRIGHIGQVAKDINVYQITTLPTDITNILNSYEGSGVTNAEPDLCAQVPQGQDASRLNVTTIETTLQTLAQATVERMVYRDNPQISRTNLLVNLNEVIRQMLASGATVKAATVTIAIAAIAGYTNNGNGWVVGSVKRGDGRNQENLFAEVGRLTCTSDAQTGGAIVNNETFTFTGAEAQPNVFHWEWPLGSGATTSLQSCDATKSNASGNLLTNGGFDSFTVNTPNNWSVLAGTAGTDFLKDTAAAYPDGGGSDLKFPGGTATLASLAQQFNLTSGTPAVLKPDVPYAHNLLIKADVVPASGAITIDLIDNNANTINDDQGVANSYTITLSTISTSYANYSGVFRLPRVLPATVRIRYRVTTAIPSGTNIFIDHTAMTAATKLYPGGPFLAIFSGSTPWISGDKFSVTTTNDRGGAANLASFQTLWDRLMNMRQNELLLPSSASPTIPDSLIS